MYFMRIKGGNIDNMKAITVIQPWASLLAEGAKLYETRSWKTNYRGEILIHAGKKDPLFGMSQWVTKHGLMPVSLSAYTER